MSQPLPSTSPQSEKSSNSLLLLVLAITFLVWLPCVFNDFVEWDDTSLLITNPHFSPPTLDSFFYYWTHPFFGLYMPITCDAWALLAKIGWVGTPDSFGARMNPYVFHLGSLILHAISAGLLFEILTFVSANPFFAAAGALMFALHPIQTEAVAFAGALNNPLLGVFSFLAILQYLKFVQSGRRVFYAMAIIALIFATLTKPTAVVIPPTLLLLDRAIFKRRWGEIVRSAWPFVVLVVPCAVMTPYFQPGAAAPPVPAWFRPFIAADSFWFYMSKTCVPLRLGIDYGRRPDVLLGSREAFITWIIPATAIVIAWLMRNRVPILLTAVLVYFVCLLPNSGLLATNVQIYSTVADRYVYLAMLAPSMLITVALTCLRPRATILISTVVLVVLVALTQLQIRTWKNGQALYEQAIAVNPKSWLAYGNLGDVLAKSNPQAAIQVTLKAIELNPTYAVAFNNLGSLQMDQDSTEAAIVSFKRAHELDPQNPLYASNFARAVEAKGSAIHR